MLSLSDIVNVKVGIGRGVFEAPGATVIGGKKPSFNLEILKLFANGEQGFWYDPNDMGTMFQDAAGTVPVTAVGQPVGLVLDKSKGLRLEKNLVLGDGKHEGSLIHINKYDANGAVSDLSLNTVNPLSGSKDVRYRLTSSSTSGALRPIMTVLVSEKPVVGSFYEFSFKYRVISGEAKIRAYHSGLSTHNMNHTLTGEGTFKIVMAYLGTAVEAPTIYFGESLFDMQMDDFEYRRIQGNHAYQTISASRPVLRQNAVTGAYYLDFDGVDDFLETTAFACPVPFSTMIGLTSGALLSTRAVLSGGAGGYLYTSGGGTTLNLQQTSTLFGINKNVTDTVFHRSDSSGVTLKSSLEDVTRNDIASANPYAGNAAKFIGKYNAASTSHTAMHIYAIILIGKALTSSEEAELRKHLNKRMGI